MRLYASLLAASLFATPAFAQTAAAPAPVSTPDATAPATTPTDTSSPATTTGHHRHAHRETLKQRFETANTSHDGHLTLDQAKAGLPMVAKHFSAIDKDNKGYVTLDEVHDYAVAARRARHHTTG